MASLIELADRRFREACGRAPEALGLAPGRVEFIGNHTDYNNGLVIGAAIDRYVAVAAGRREAPGMRLISGSGKEVALSDLSKPLDGEDSWANYPLGVYHALARRGLKLDGGLELAVESDLPVGAGLSSSAALELATAQALRQLGGLELSPAELAVACREAENGFVGLPCGILDQGVSAHGKSGHLVCIDCSGPTFETLPLGEEHCLWIFNTHKKHSLIDSLYETRHRECQEALRGLRRAGLDIQWLAEATPEQFMAVKDRIDPTLAKRAQHVIEENERVKRTKKVLEAGDIETAGELLFASHRSSRLLFENSCEELDYLVDILSSMPGVLGARLTGGGFGGAVMALARPSMSEKYAKAVAAAYRGRFGKEPETLRCRAADGAQAVMVEA